MRYEKEFPQSLRKEIDEYFESLSASDGEASQRETSVQHSDAPESQGVGSEKQEGEPLITRRDFLFAALGATGTSIIGTSLWAISRSDSNDPEKHVNLDNLTGIKPRHYLSDNVILDLQSVPLLDENGSSKTLGDTEYLNNSWVFTGDIQVINKPLLIDYLQDKEGVAIKVIRSMQNDIHPREALYIPFSSVRNQNEENIFQKDLRSGLVVDGFGHLWSGGKRLSSQEEKSFGEIFKYGTNPKPTPLNR